MLLDRQKINLNKLLGKYKDFNYLRPPQAVYQIQIPEQEHFVIAGNKTRRRIYYGVKYTEQQQKAINGVRAQLENYQIYENLTDQLILKHLYTTSMNQSKTLDRLLEVQHFHNNPDIIKFTQQTQNNLKKGGIYTYGHDRNMKPIVILRPDKFDTTQSVEQHYNAAYYIMLVVIAYRLVPYHAQKYNMIIDFNNTKISNLPITYLYEVLSKMGVYYCGNVERCFIYNFKTLSFLWSKLSHFIPEHAKKKIMFMEEGLYHLIYQLIEPSQLERKYGGKEPNLNQYWPPKQIIHNKVNHQDTSESEYLSIQNDYSYFGDKNQPTGCCVQCCIY